MDKCLDIVKDVKNNNTLQIKSLKSNDETVGPCREQAVEDAEINRGQTNTTTNRGKG